MPAQINSEVKGAILMGYQNGDSCRKICGKLLELGMTAGKSTVSRAIKEFKMEQQGATKPAKKLGTQMLPSVRTTETIKKVEKLVFSARSFYHPTNYAAVGTLLRHSAADYCQGFGREEALQDEDLSDKQAAQRVLKFPRLLEHIKRGKWKYIVSIDQAWCYMSHVNGRRRIYYKFRGRRAPKVG
ncbi:hypothetical protein BV898_16243 [Hypsibius exemplaris]|uniref:Uncharacterized protein n=1 Tax=Hypsibius exemplaris TaxID=2072580 RepID=A0A9X6NJW0_HYPEX|nr:hypothetical protein BV898_16243 [Hypsibius exemplaris]